MTTSLMVHDSVLYVPFGEYLSPGDAQQLLTAPEEQVHPDALRRMDKCRFAMNVTYSTLKFEY